MRKAALAQKLPHDRKFEQLGIDSSSQGKLLGKESGSGGASLSIQHHRQDFQQEPDLECS